METLFYYLNCKKPSNKMKLKRPQMSYESSTTYNKLSGRTISLESGIDFKYAARHHRRVSHSKYYNARRHNETSIASGSH